MSESERQLIALGAVLIKTGKHKIYEIQGRRFTISHSKKANDNRDRRKPMLHFLRKLAANK